MKLELDIKGCKGFIADDALEAGLARSVKYLDMVTGRSGPGNEFLGWLDLPEAAAETLPGIMETAAKLRQYASTSVVIGIGGSYLGARAVISSMGNELTGRISGDSHRVVFAGHHLGEDYISGLIEFLGHEPFNIIVISKSGTTTEPAIAFRILRKHLESITGKSGAAKHITAITDADHGALRMIAGQEGYRRFVIPDDIGGRYSVLTPVGLLPIACAGLDAEGLVSGAIEMARLTRDNRKPGENPSLIYSTVRNLLHETGRPVEMMVNFEPALQFVAEWWKQLFGESEGKQGKGIFPASAGFTTDLHSLGQYIQDGQRIIFETVLSVERSQSEVVIENENEDFDRLNYLAGKRLSYVNHKAEEGTIMAHNDGGVPVIRIILPEISERYIGQLFYLFEIACAVSGYSIGVNPFDQPGVEAYKSNMFRLLGKK